MTSTLEVEVQSVKIVYFYEMSFRIIDYFMDKLLWAITESSPYLNANGKVIREPDIDFKHMETKDIDAFELQ